MIITCLKCNSKFSINKTILGKNGRKVKCSDCENEWHQNPIIKKKDLVKENKSTDEQKIFANEKKESDETKIFFSQQKKEKKSYKFLYLFILIVLSLFIYLYKINNNFDVKNYFFKFVKKDFLINKSNIDSFDLVLNQIEKEINILNNNQRVIKIFGKISNTSNEKKHELPKLQATLFDSKNNIISQWFFYADQEHLNPQESLNFNTSYIHDNQDISDIKIEFIENSNE